MDGVHASGRQILRLQLCSHREIASQVITAALLLLLEDYCCYWARQKNHQIIQTHPRVIFSWHTPAYLPKKQLNNDTLIYSIPEPGRFTAVLG